MQTGRRVQVQSWTGSLDYVKKADGGYEALVSTPSATKRKKKKHLKADTGDFPFAVCEIAIISVALIHFSKIKSLVLPLGNIKTPQRGTCLLWCTSASCFTYANVFQTPTLLLFAVFTTSCDVT